MAEENLIETKLINELLNKEFFVPDYQRGYRWNRQQIRDLLNDLQEFLSTKQPSEHYCLQPVVVKQKENSEAWEVIDGQQRLTTIFILLKYLFKLTGNPKYKPFSITYATRDKSENFLNDADFTRENENIDFFYICQAFKHIENWFAEKEADPDARAELAWKFRDTLRNSVEVIWYQINDGTSPVELFTKINMGKIDLTNAELIKALVLGNREIDKRRHLDIAAEWDRMENELQEDSFWYFISNGETFQNRIDYLFKLIAGLKNSELQEKISDTENKYFVFLVFDRYFKEHRAVAQSQESSVGNVVEKTWLLVRKYYSFFRHWYKTHDLYHKVGYLIYFKQDMAKILQAAENCRKNEFHRQLDKMIVDTLKPLLNDKKQLDISRLNYGDKLIKNVLLLHNLLTLKHEEHRFPFEQFKKDNWNIEHIHAVADKIPTTPAERERRLSESIEWIGDAELKKSAEDFLAAGNFRDDSGFISLYEKIIGEGSGSEQIDINDISNLTLLDEATNKAYKNAIFPVKRKKIIERDRNGQFIPVCTRNVFMKYYSVDAKNILIWNAQDRDAYFKDMEQKIDAFVKGATA